MICLIIAITQNIYSPYFSKADENVIAKFKDEASSNQISEFVGLRSKRYSYNKDNGYKNTKITRAAKGTC